MLELIELVRKIPSNDNHPLDLTIGSTVYYPLWREGLVVEAKVEELQFVLPHPNYPESIWLYVDLEAYEDGFWCSVPKVPLEKDPQGWTIKEDLRDLERVKKLVSEATLASWGAWIDLPVGHAVWPGLDFATDPSFIMPNMKPRRFKKRTIKKALDHYINRGRRFIAYTHKKSVTAMNFPHYATYPERRAFWRRK